MGGKFDEWYIILLVITVFGDIFYKTW
jgi:hypothetical protein